MAVAPSIPSASSSTPRPRPPPSRLQDLDRKADLMGDILSKVDRASVAVRVPILDHLVVERLATESSRLKLNGREGKYIFDKVLERLVPLNVLYRPKMGYTVLIEKWLRSELRGEVGAALPGEPLAAGGYCERRFVARFAGAHARCPQLHPLDLVPAHVRRLPARRGGGKRWYGSDEPAVAVTTIVAR
jgi:asparagine synthetase B (glutamine-hydrolysing)